MRRTIVILWLWWKNYRIYRRRAWALAWEDASQKIDSSDFDQYQLDEMLSIPTSYTVNPFGRFRDLNERLNDEG